MRINKQHITEQEIVFDDNVEEQNAIFDSELHKCELVFNCTAKWYLLARTTITDSLFWQKKVLKNEQFDTVHFKRVKFKGQFMGVDFGGFENSIHPKELGSLEHCDFTEAKVHACRIFNSDFLNNRYQQWPIVVVRMGGSFKLPDGMPPLEKGGWKRLLMRYEQHQFGVGVVIHDVTKLSVEHEIPVERLRTFFELNKEHVISGLD